MRRRTTSNRVAADLTCYLVTGAAGLLGSEIAGALADRGDSVIGMVRKNRTLLRHDRRSVPTIDWSGLRPAPGEIALVHGDVRDPRLGLSAADYDAISAQVDGIIHCAAIVQFDADPAVYEAVNVGGTRHALDFARARPEGPAGFVQVSTAYVCGERAGAIGEDGGEAPGRFANGYEASKFAAEQLVREAMAQGVRAAIARPSIVIGGESDGAIAAFDSIYMAFKLLAEGRIRTIPSAPSATLNFVPIDHVVKAIVTIAGRPAEAAGHAFHLVSRVPMPVIDFFDLIGAYPQFAHPECVSLETFDPASLSPIEQRFHRRVATLYTSYFQRNPLFSEDNMERVLGFRGPVADQALLRRQIDYSIRAGFLSPESLCA